MSCVTRSDQKGITTLTLTKPPINALDREGLEELDRTLQDLERNSDVRVVVLASGVEGVFCTGGDLKFWRRFPRDASRQVSRAGRNVFTRLERLPCPTIAAIEGHVIGDGLALALAADLRIASETASFRVPEADYGFIPGWGVPYRLERTVGQAAALELLLTGLAIGAERARQLGLVSQVVPAGQALPASRELSEQISRKSPLALAWAKQVLREAPDVPDRGPWEEECFAQVWGGADWQEGVEALLAKRPPVFTNLAARRSQGRAK